MGQAIAAKGSAAQGSWRAALRPAAVFATLREAMQRRRVYRQTLRELRSLSRRQLEDKGIGPEMITRLAAEAAYGRKSELRPEDWPRD